MSSFGAIESLLQAMTLAISELVLEYVIHFGTAA